MPRTEEANQRIRDERREQVLTAARQVFARKGFTDTKIADIAAAAGISHGLAYRYFDSKEAVFTELVERALAGATRLAYAAQMQPGTPWERLRWLVEQILPGMIEKPEYTPVTLHAISNEAVPAEVRERAVRQSLVTRDVVRQLIVEGQAAGQVVAGDPDRLTILFLSCIQGLGQAAAFMREFFPVFPDAEMVLRILKP
jgi:AcrR family transcriptional regulator